MTQGSRRRFVQGQSPDETAFCHVVHGVIRADRGIMVSMRFIISSALVALSAPAVAQERGPHAVVVVARAQIISGCESLRLNIQTMVHYRSDRTADRWRASGRVLKTNRVHVGF